MISSLYAEEYADFILLENPLDYSILNKYEQRITDSEKAKFIPFSLLQVIDNNDTLGDGISAALKFQFMKNTFFLPRDDEGNFLCSTKKTALQTFKKCVVIGDTIRIIRDNTVLLTDKYPSAGKQVYLKKGSMVYRLFKYNNYYYVMTDKRYGWCLLPDRSVWKKDEVPEKKEDPQFKTELWNRIAAKMEAVNETYVEYFDFFNSSSNGLLFIGVKSKSIHSIILYSYNFIKNF